MDHKFTIAALFLTLFIFNSCSKEADFNPPVKISESDIKKYPVTDKKLPENLKWETNDSDPEWSSPDAKKGGTFTSSMTSFPLTLRMVGPDSNGGFASELRSNQMSLTDVHPNTGNIIPALATHWTYDSDGKTVYYKLDPDAKWSDGRQITADDYIFTLDFMRSKEIVDPWSNNYYTDQIIDVKKYDDFTISVTGKNPKSKRLLHIFYGISPTPRHFYVLNNNFVKDYNWRVCPNTGAYQITDLKKGKYITFARKKDWWAKDKRYYRNRHNVDYVKFNIIRDINVAWEYFKKGQIDSFGLTLPEYWHEKAKDSIFDNGYCVKMWFYVDKPQPEYGMWMNISKDILKDINVRKGIAHSLNFDKVFQTVLRNDYQRLQTTSVGYGKYTNSAIHEREFNIDLADKYFKLAGWDKRGPDGIRVKDGKRLSVTITYGQDFHTNRLEILKEEAKKTGLELNLQLLDSSSAFKAMLEKQHEIAYMGWSTGIIPAFWEHWHSKNANIPQTNNLSNVSDKKLDDLIDRYDNETDEDKAAALSREIQQTIFDEALVIHTWLVPYFREGYWRWWKLPEVPATKTSDSLLDPFGTTGGLFWLDEDEKLKTEKAMKSGEKFPTITIVNTKYKVN